MGIIMVKLEPSVTQPCILSMDVRQSHQCALVKTSITIQQRGDNFAQEIRRI